MAHSTHRIAPNRFVHMTDMDSVHFETRQFMASRHTNTSMLEIAEQFAPHATQIAAELPAEASIGVLHSDFFREVRVVRLPGGYRATLPVSRVASRDAATRLHVFSGEVTITRRGDGELTQHLGPGEGLTLDNEAPHTVTVSDDALVLQLVSPRNDYFGRPADLFLPAPATRSPAPVGVSPVSALPTNRGRMPIPGLNPLATRRPAIRVQLRGLP